MKVSRNSWHFRWLRLVYGEDKNYRSISTVLTPGFMHFIHHDFNGPRSLCPYFWAMFFSPAFAGILLLIVPFMWILGVTVILLWMSLTVLFRSIRWAWRHRPTLALKRRVQSKHNDEPSVVLEFIKARKRNVCPVIKYQDAS